MACAIFLSPKPHASLTTTGSTLITCCRKSNHRGVDHSERLLRDPKRKQLVHHDEELARGHADLLVLPAADDPAAVAEVEAGRAAQTCGRS